MQLQQADLEFLRRFTRMPEGRVWLELLQRNLAETDAKLRSAVGDDLLRTQGRAQFLADLIDRVQRADEALERGERTRRIVANPTGQPSGATPWQA